MPEADRLAYFAAAAKGLPASNPTQAPGCSASDKTPLSQSSIGHRAERCWPSKS